MWLPIVLLAFWRVDSAMHRECMSQGEIAMYQLELLLGELTVLIFVLATDLLAKS